MSIILIWLVRQRGTGVCRTVSKGRIGMNGVVLYVDLIRLEEVADRYSQIDMQMKSLLSSYERSISYLKGCEYRGEIPPNMIGVHNAEMQEIEERIRSLQSCLKSVLDIYRGYEKEFHAREIGNLYETTPFYKTNGFKIGVGAFVVTGCVVLAVVAFPGVAIVTGAAVGSALGAAFGGTIGGITAERNGGSFLDGFADGMLVGAIGGAISGAVGEATATAGLVVSVVANGVTDSAIYAGETAYRGGEITSRGLTVSFLTGAVLSGVTRIGVGKYTKAKGIESGIDSSNPFYKQGGGSDLDDFMSIHAQKHAYNPEVKSTKNKTQFGENIDVAKLREDTLLHPDQVIYDSEHNIIKYVKEYDFNISTSDTPTGSHRVFINLATRAGKTIRNSQFPYYGGYK